MKLDRVFKRIKTGIAICDSGFLIRKNNLIGLIQMSDIVLSENMRFIRTESRHQVLYQK